MKTQKLNYSISIIVIILLFLLGYNKNQSINEIEKYYNVDSLYALTQEPQSNIIVLDVRSTAEFASGHIPTAINICSCEVEKCLKNVSKSKRYIIYCQTGYRSNKVCEIFKDNGYRYVLDWGGVHRWIYEFELQ